MLETEEIQTALNKLINLCAKQGGHVYIVDKQQNRFALRLTEEVKIQGFVPKRNGGEDLSQSVECSPRK